MEDEELRKVTSLYSVLIVKIGERSWSSAGKFDECIFLFRNHMGTLEKTRLLRLKNIVKLDH